MEDEDDEFASERKEFMSRVFGTPLQRRFIGAIWSAQYDEIMGKLLYQMVHVMQAMDESDLLDLVNLLEHEDIRGTTACNTAFILLIKNTPDRDLHIWTGLMYRHFLKMQEYTVEDGVKLNENSKLIIMDALVMYSLERPHLTVEQEKALIRMTASDLGNKNPAITRPTNNVNIRDFDDTSMLDYVLENGDKVGLIIKAMVVEKMTRIAQIESYINGETPSLTGGAL